MYKYLFLITATLFLSSCFSDSSVENDSDNTKTVTSQTSQSEEKSSLSDEQIATIKSSMPTLESAISNFKNQSPEEASSSSDSIPLMLERMLVWHTVVGINWQDINNLTETSYPKMKKDILAESGKKYCFEGMVRHIVVDRTFEVPLTHAVMYVPYEDYVFVLAVGSSGDIVEKKSARFCGIATGTRDYQTAMGTNSAPYLLGMFDLPENK